MLLVFKRTVSINILKHIYLNKYFINDLPSHVDPFGHCYMHTDYKAVVSTTCSIENLKINSYIAANWTLDYCSMNDFNEDKTKQLMIGTHKNEISGLPYLQTLNSIKYLGILTTVFPGARPFFEAKFCYIRHQEDSSHRHSGYIKSSLPWSV